MRRDILTWEEYLDLTDDERALLPPPREYSRKVSRAVIRHGEEPTDG